MSQYIIRNAVKTDIPFLADVVIAAEKGGSDKLSFSTLFNLTENEVKDLLIAIFEEEIDGCELSLNSFLVVEHNGELVAASGAWIEMLDGGMSSQLLKSNLISYTFKKESIAFLKTKADIIKDILIEREPLTLQFEYLYIKQDYAGRGIDIELVQRNEKKAVEKFPDLKKAQCQLFKNNIFAVKMALKKGFKITKSYKVADSNILDYLAGDEKILMEKIYINETNGEG